MNRSAHSVSLGWSRRALIAVAWLLLFLGVYFSQPLPNNGGIVRWQLWPELPFAVMDAVDPPQEPGSPPRGWAYLGQRLPLMLTAAVIAFGAWGCGTCVLARCSLGATGGGFGSPGSSSVDRTVVVGLEDLAHPTNVPIARGEWLYFRLLIGLGVVSFATLLFGLAGILNRWLFLSAFVAAGIAGLVVACRSLVVLGATGGSSEPPVSSGPGTIVGKHTGSPKLLPVAPGQRFRREHWLLVVAVAPFLLGMLFGSLSPSTDFDVNEYHLGGPKEWFLAGRITFLDHDVYTSFPFLTEMLLLAGMVVHGDWFHGALAGQLVLMLFAPLTALGIYCIGRRWFSPLAGSLGALIYLTTPWVFRMSIIAYAEGGLTAYTCGAIVAGLIAIDRIRQWPEPTVPCEAWAPILLTGLCAGGAMACKYTGLVMAVAPWAVALMLVVARLNAAALPLRLRSVLFTSVVFLAGVFAMVGPWLVKNLVETGNPVYPLGYSVFDGRDLDDALAEKWRNGHARPNKGSVTGEVRDLFVKIFDVATVNDWTNPLVFAFAPLAVLWPGERRRIYMLWGLTAWLFLCWWLFTHHLDRFWLPLLPAACVLAGIGAASLVCHGRLGRAELDTARSARTADTAVAHKRSAIGYAAIGALGVGWVYDLGFCSTGLVGYNAGLTDLKYARDYATRITGPEIAWLNAAIDEGTLPRETKVLCVGEAELFHARFPYVYNTVFDRSIFEEWCGEPGDAPSKERPLRPAEAIRETLSANGITHVFVNWAEIVRYRQTYGYTDFAHPSRFTALQQLGMLGEPLRLPNGLGLRPFENLSTGEQQSLREWAPELIVPCGDGRCMVTGQVFPVVR
ncbi:MAG TPA: hypothetical protein VM165_09705 [Planctomycetaceae bacterium]|nr:hypothetical protein [Planctomycetaceae bacterium]